ncbi:cellulase family glycosylhydrolase [Balneolaceae bacterium ANBcel3]|nr:cellulase family glycosylhydrolase [Balneolaceae bacterium ANBcel3]
MEHLHSFRRGMNLGGWLSQYPKPDKHHFDTFITKKDIQTIAGWGFDHIRLPVDYPIIEHDDRPGTYLDEGLSYIDRCFEWCEESGLAVVLDLHHAPGFTFNHALKDETRHLNTLFTDEKDQQRFIHLWKFLLNRYHTASTPVIFELLNEVVLPESGPWNVLAKRAVEELRKESKSAKILIGGNHNNAASELKNLEVLPDPNVLYGFHFYDPLLFTHQKAPWVEASVDYQATLAWNGPFSGLEAFLNQHPKHASAFRHLTGRTIDKELLHECMQPAFDFLLSHQRPLYCGEFGVIDIVASSCRNDWHAETIRLFNQYDIGWAVWTYKELDFGIVDYDGKVRDPNLLDILCTI